MSGWGAVRASGCKQDERRCGRLRPADVADTLTAGNEMVIFPATAASRPPAGRDRAAFIVHPPRGTRTQAEQSAGPGPAGPRILIIEDLRDTADTLRRLLEILGYEVAVAYTGPEGVQRALEWLPDVVLSDLGLPGLDGFGVAAALRRNPVMARVRLIAITGYGSPEARKRSREAGFDEHLVKPVDLALLRSVLDQP